MKTGAWLSPVRIINTELLGIRLEIVNGNLFANSELTITIGLQMEHPEKQDDLNLGKCALEFKGVWHEPGNSESVYFVVDCKVGMTIGIQDSSFEKGYPADRIGRYIDTNAVSLAYSQIRSHVEYITSQSPFGRQIIPAIDPISLLNSLVVDESQSSDDQRD